jgi:chaperonin GroEL
MKELKDRIEDTICSVKASIKEGIVLGGGVTLLKVSEELVPPKELTSDQLCGFNLVKKALQSPIRQLAENSGLSADVVVDKVLKDSDGEKSGYNFATKEWDDNLFDTVVDPTLVETNAIMNASSVISLYLTTEVAITTETKNEEINER